MGRFLLRSGLPLANSVLMVSGRVSFEIVQKAAVAGIPILWAIAKRPQRGILVLAGVACLLLRLRERVASLLLHLSREALDPATLRLGAGDVPYCRIKGGKFEARFSRAAAWQLLQHMEPGAAGARSRAGGW